MILGVVFPRWAMNATARLAKARDAIDELKASDMRSQSGTPR